MIRPGSAWILGLCLVGTVAVSCMIENYPSVHFNSKEPDFGAAPRPFSIESWGEAGYRPIGSGPRNYTNWNEDEYRRGRWESRGEEALANARQLESEGRFTEAMVHYRNALRHGAGDPAAIRDREEISRELRRSTSRKLLKDYLSARSDYETFHLKRAEQSMKGLAANPQAGFLRAHAVYVLGAIQYDRRRFKDAATIFEHLAAAYPRSPRCEAALIMVPRSLLRSPVQKEDYPYTWLDTPLPDRASIQPSRRALQRLLREYPSTRFRQDALGWLARCNYVLGHRAPAFEAYLRQLGSSITEDDRTSAAASILFVTRKLSAADSRVLRADLLRDSSLLEPYLDYRLYHSYPDKRDLARLTDLATAASKRGGLRLPGKIAARLAEILYLQGRYAGAIDWSNRAISATDYGGRDLAIYVRGASRTKLRRMRGGESDFLTVLRRYPKSYLVGGARENLALIYERTGRPAMALDEYFRLGYREDIAYMLDVKMTTRQVAAYVRTHPRHKERDVLVYTLGIRQLRDNALSSAERTLSRLPDRTLRRLMSAQKTDYWWDSIHCRPRDPQKTTRELMSLERAVRKARSQDARAAALYAEASYFYQNRDLLFYNAALWQGARSTDFGFYWNPKAATDADVTAVRKHHHEHECLYRVRQMCLDIARQYPNAPSAPKAIYRAACATELLTDFSYWWRSEAERLDLSSQSVRLMKRVYEKYPNDSLARPARKYAQVFARGRDEASRTTMFEIANRQ